MARARLVPPQPVEQDVELVLTRREAEVLKYIADHIGGSISGPRSAIIEIQKALSSAGIPLVSNIKRTSGASIYIEQDS